MAASHPSVVVADGEEVVDGHPMLGVDHILGHVQPLGEVNYIVGSISKDPPSGIGNSPWLENLSLCLSCLSSICCRRTA